MSTNSIVFERTEGGVKGVYVHFDGSPTSRLAVLGELIQRDGVDKVMSTILGKPNGWSCLDPGQGDELLLPYLQDGRFLAVPGYGVEYTHVEGQANTHYTTPVEVEGDVWIEYLYIVEQDGTISWSANEGPWSYLRWQSTAKAGAP